MINKLYCYRKLFKIFKFFITTNHLGTLSSQNTHKVSQNINVKLNNNLSLV